MEQEKKQIPEYLYKIVSPEQWQQSLQQNKLSNSEMDEDFIHLATAEQLNHIAQKFWNQKKYVILKLDTKKITGLMAYETNPGGNTRYYHLYEGNIPLDAVVEVSKENPIDH
ncbi:MAG: DUF952 domain-containing protein [Candidatus Protochlamydia sp.]|nr:DUF952 domain-containing protein [Candidatus Protochlamydia sp.]